MKNVFKNSNSSRFNSLNNSLKEYNGNKWEREKERDNGFTNNYNYPRSNSSNFKSSNNKKSNTFVLDESSFPVMGTIVTKQSHPDVNMDYLNKTKIETLLNVESSLENHEIPEIPEGIVLLKYENGNIIWKNKRNPECEIKENDFERNNKIINKLVENYENYKQRFDELWGEGEYDKIYKSENHDYEYFDRLDEEEEYLNVTSDYEYKEDSDY